VWAVNKHFDESKPTLLLNSHHDTVKPNSLYTKDPFTPILEDGKLYGLGSNDAGGCLVSLIATFLYFYEKENLEYNLILAATAEEEISGANGIEALLKQLGPIDCAIVGEPTQMQMAVAERGLMVLDCLATGRAGHAARKEGDNAIYKAISDINWFTSYRFSKVSDLLGPVNMDVTVIETDNKAHNVVPAQCKFVVDVRVNEHYTFEEVLGEIRNNIQSEAKPRSIRLRSTSIALDHPLVKAGLALGRTYYGSPTTSDKALMFFPSLKIGPGDSARSHTADEYIYVEEIKEGIELYIQLLNEVV
jgi:acetylornithine deacetylase